MFPEQFFDLLFGRTWIASLPKKLPTSSNYASGIMGNIDVLNTFYYKLNKKQKSDYLQNSVAECIQNKNPKREWALPALDKNNQCFVDEMYGLFTGISGIANTLIYLIDYDKTYKLFK